MADSTEQNLTSTFGRMEIRSFASDSSEDYSADSSFDDDYIEDYRNSNFSYGIEEDQNSNVDGDDIEENPDSVVNSASELEGVQAPEPGPSPGSSSRTSPPCSSSTTPENNLLTQLRFQRYKTNNVGSALKLRFIKPLEGQTVRKPLFEFSVLTKDYITMEKVMLEDCNMPFFDSEPILHPSQIRKGDHAILVEADGKACHRIKFLANPSNDGVEIEMVDYYVKKKVDIRSKFLYMHRMYARFPSRVLGLEMEGISHYLDHELFQQFVNPSSEQFLFGGELTAIVKSSGVVVYSETFPESSPYGINGYIIDTFIKTLQEPKLPKLFGTKQKVFVVHAEPNGVVSLQTTSAISDHFMDVFGTFTSQHISRLSGNIELGPTLDKEVKYYAPSEIDKTYYRAIIVSQVDDTKVHVLFIDYGNEATVNISDLVRCKDVHPLMETFPPQCLKVHLDNVKNLQVADFQRKYATDNHNYSVQLVKEESNDSLAQVLLWGTNSEKSLNQIIIDSKLGESINPNYMPAVAHGYSDMLMIKPSLHLILAEGKRLSPDTEFKVKVTYHECMGDKFFITPTAAYCRQQEFQNKIEKEYRITYSSVPEIYFECYSKGSVMLCNSRILCHVARALLIEKLENTAREGWLVYLMDYGIYENFPQDNFRMLMPQFVTTTPFGIRATRDKYDTPEKIKMWASEWGHKSTVKVLSIDKDQLGEIARVVVVGEI